LTIFFDSQAESFVESIMLYLANKLFVMKQLLRWTQRDTNQQFKPLTVSEQYTGNVLLSKFLGLNVEE
jgi:hypothetical protein